MCDDTVLIPTVTLVLLRTQQPHLLHLFSIILFILFLLAISTAVFPVKAVFCFIFCSDFLSPIFQVHETSNLSSLFTVVASKLFHPLEYVYRHDSHSNNGGKILTLLKLLPFTSVTDYASSLPS